MSTCFESSRALQPMRAGRRCRQRGDMLLEALIGVLITALLGAALAHVLAQVMSSQRDTKVERLVVNKLRDNLQTSGTTLCDSGTVELALTDTLTRSASVSCGTAPTLAVSVGSVSESIEAPRQVDLTVSASDLQLDGEEADTGGADLLVSSKQ